MTESTGPGSLAGRKVLLGVSGGIAAYKAVLLARLLATEGASVQAVLTGTATRFVGLPTFAAITGHPARSEVLEEPERVVHVRLARAAEVAIVAPATANVIAKISLGLADDLLTATLLEARCPLVVAPAMHSGMLQHPATQSHLATLAARGVTIVGPATGPLAAGDEGPGRMSEPEDILAAAIGVLGPRDLVGRTVLVTAGPTHEPIDPVRFIGNRSSGRMGFAVAREAGRRGARVLIVAGPTTVPPPPGAEVVRVETAEEMRAAVEGRIEGADVLVMAAAVADFRTAEPATGKLKKESGPPRLDLVPTIDILKEVGRRAGDRVLVGFAAETDDLEEAARKKLVDKGLDLVVANLVGAPGTGFGSETNRALIVARDGDDVALNETTKDDLARLIVDRVARILSARSV